MDSPLAYLAMALISVLLVSYGLRKNLRLATIFGLSLPVLYSGLRSHSGTDFSKYVTMYQEVTSVSFQDFMSTYTVEPTFYILSITSKLLFDSPFLVFFSFSLLTIVFFYLGLIKHTSKTTHVVFAYLSYLLLLFPNTMNIARQGLAISIVFYALSFIPTRNVRKYLKWMLVATLFHYSTMIMLPVYLLNRVISNRITDAANQIRILYLCATVALIVPLVLIIGVNTLSLPAKYQDYITGNESGANVLFYLSAVIMLCIAAIFMLYKKQNKILSMYYYMYCMLTTALLCAGFFISETRRISLYLLPFMGLLIPIVVDMLSPGIPKSIVKFSAYCYIIGYFILFYVAAGYGGVFPYQTIFTRSY